MNHNLEGPEMGFTLLYSLHIHSWSCNDIIFENGNKLEPIYKIKGKKKYLKLNLTKSYNIKNEALEKFKWIFLT